MSRSTILIITALIVVVVAAGGFLWVGQKSLNNYVNTDGAFSLFIPEGYIVHESDSSYFTISAEPTDEKPTPVQEMFVQIERGETIDNYRDELKEAGVEAKKVEPLEVDGVTGVVLYHSYPYPLFSSEPPYEELDTSEIFCPSYLLEHKKTLYRFATWECMESPIFDDVLQSFRLILKDVN